MTFKYEADKDILIKTHEEEMLKKYSEYVNQYSYVFMMHSYNVVIGLYWEDKTKKHYYNRIPISEGYNCYVYCEVKKDGNTVIIESNDGEADYYLLSEAWQVSSIEKRLGKIVAILYSNDEQVVKDLEDFIFMLGNN